jgi:2-amino-4-hydroxy-6-hydroxymethyldihydropteridine diphosphokinase
VRLLAERCAVLARSPVYRTPPQGFADQPDFYNMAVKVATALSPADFKQDVLARIEQALGRLRDPHNRNAPRTIDLDIALWGEAVLEYGAKPWRVPDPDILRFAHLAVPLAALAPDYVHPETGATLAQIAGRFDASAMQVVALDFP